jgi:uncharacterized protein involved in outer membrane biogenesis
LTVSNSSLIIIFVKIPRWIKISSAVAAILIVAFIVGFYFYVKTIDFDHYADLAATKIEAATGRVFRIGKIDVNFFPGIDLVAENVLLGNAPWSSKPDMVKIKRLEGRVAIMSLLQRRLEIDRLEVSESNILIEQDEKGIGNWVFGTQQPDKTSVKSDGGASFALTGLDEVLFEKSVLTFKRPGMTEPLQLAIQRLKMNAETLSGKSEFELDAVFQGQQFTVKGTNGLIERILKKDSNWPLSFDVRVDGARAKVESTLDWRSAPPMAHGAIELNIDDTGGLEKLIGTPFELPLPLTLKANVKSADSQYLIEPFSTGIGESTISGSIAIKTGGDRPSVKANLKASALDLSRREASNNKTAKANGRVFSDAPFPLEVLRGLDAQVEARIDRLILTNKLPMEALGVTATLQNGRLEVHPLAATVGGGKLTANLTLETAASKVATLTIKAEGKGISGEELVAAMGYAGAVADGSTDFAIHLTGPGASLARFMAGANGEAHLVVGSAVISGAALDWGGDTLTQLLDLVNPFHRSEKKTHLSCMVVRLPAHSGIIIVDRTIAAETNRLNMVAVGQIDLRKETINLGFKSRAKEGIGIGVVNLAELVKLSGTLSNPKVGVDTIASAKKALSVGGALATAGLSLIGEAFLKKTTADPHPCRTALSRGGSTSSASPGKDAKAQEKRKEGGVVDSLKNLFRKQ